MILLNVLTTFLLMLGLGPTPEATEPGTPNVFVDLGPAYCADAVAIAAYVNILDDVGSYNGEVGYVVYSGYDFASTEQAIAALDDIPVLVARTLSGDPDIDRHPDFDQYVTRLPTTEDFGDRAARYSITIPQPGDELLFVNALAIVKGQQLLLMLLFSGTGPSQPSPGLVAGDFLPFTEGLDELWDGTGDIEDAIPNEHEMPLGWVRQDTSTVKPPVCEGQG